MAKKEKSEMLESGEPLPGESPEFTDPVNGEQEAPKDVPLKFGNLSTDIDPYQLGFHRFDAVGSTIDFQYARRWAPGEKSKDLEYACLEGKRYPDGSPVLLPGNTQLWEVFGNLENAKADFARTVYRITCVERVPDPKNTEKAKFVRFMIQPATLP